MHTSCKSEPHKESVDAFFYQDLEILAEHGIIQKNAQELRAKFPPQSPTEQRGNNLKHKVLIDMYINVHFKILSINTTFCIFFFCSLNFLPNLKNSGRLGQGSQLRLACFVLGP